MYQRLRELEDRVRYLESVSPEYFSAELKKVKGEGGEGDATRQKVNEASLSAINTRIQQLQQSLRVKNEGDDEDMN